MFRMKDKTLDGLDADKIKKNYWTYILLFLAVLAMTFAGMCTPGGSSIGVRGSAAAVGGERITKAEFRRTYSNMNQNLQSRMGANFDPSVMQVAKTAMDQLINQRIIYLEAKKLGIGATQKEVVNYLTNVDAFKDDKGKFSKTNFSNYLRYNGYNEATFEAEIKRQIVANKFRQFLGQSQWVSSKEAEWEYMLRETKLEGEYIKIDAGKVQVEIPQTKIDEFLKVDANVAKVKSDYNSNLKDYKKPQKVEARHILISFKGARNASPEAAKRSPEEALKIAQQVAVDANKEGADFAQLAKDKTDEASGKASGGSLGYFKADDMVKEFSDAAFAMKVGEVSQPVKSAFGYHIIKVTGKQEAQETSLEQATAGIAKKLLKKDLAPDAVKQRAEEVHAALLKGDAKDLLNKYELAWTKTGEFSADAYYIPGLGSDKEVRQAILATSLKDPLSKAPIKSSDNYFLFRLTAKKDAQSATAEEKTLDQLQQSISGTERNRLFSGMLEDARKDYESRQEIYRNPEYLALDQAQQQDAN